MTRGSRPRVALFVGPSVAAHDVRATWQAQDAELVLLPPAEQGDVLRLLNDPPDVLGIVDGVFFHAPAVLHREILLALERGVRVLGAASLGALRAAELDAFGMEGIGEIYHLYRRGAIDGDDEVAVLHGPAELGFRPLTEALVNVRHNLRRARRRGIVSRETAAMVAAAARCLHFTRRTYDGVLTAASREAARPEELAALRCFFQEEAVDLKRQDALALVSIIAARLRGATAWPPRPVARVTRTTYFARYEREYVGHAVDGRHVPEGLAVAFQRLLDPSLPRLQRRVALRCLALDEAAERGLVAEDGARLVARFRWAHRLESETGYAAWLGRRYLSRDELAVALTERDLEERLLALYRALAPSPATRGPLYRRLTRDVAARLGTSEAALLEAPLMRPGAAWSGPLIRELKLRGRLGPALRYAAAVLRHNAELFERYPWLDLARVRRGPLETFFARRWAIPEAELERAIRRRGFTHEGLFLEAARPVYVYERSRQAGPDGQPPDPTEWFYP